MVRSFARILKQETNQSRPRPQLNKKGDKMWGFGKKKEEKKDKEKSGGGVGKKKPFSVDGAEKAIKGRKNRRKAAMKDLFPEEK